MTIITNNAGGAPTPRPSAESRPDVAALSPGRIDPAGEAPPEPPLVAKVAGAAVNDRMQELIGQQVEAGTLTSDQASMLQSEFSGGRDEQEAPAGQDKVDALVAFVTGLREQIASRHVYSSAATAYASGQTKGVVFDSAA